MAKAKKEERKLTDHQLKTLNEKLSLIDRAKTQIGDVESQKHALLHQLAQVQLDFQNFQAELEKEYGKVNINTQDGSLTEVEDEVLEPEMEIVE